ncbi:FAD-dependent monooxygenase [Dyella sp. GSA-30]|uniref:FAD-dependent monooxygenase n=1 Tax=Dyella sp. GSA-30 TaxID=2994496 RepID=UPI002490CC69|nr:FAD-dependent monooxygenase [Dyella sp. GSA-30]BDU21162.1 flavin-dependent oxidoreductase [Dyella sp. GSA-30]
MANTQSKIVIAGAGIGGLSCALALHARGFSNITLLEAASEFRRVGVGINIQPLAIAELALVGLNDQLDRFGIRTRALDYCDSHGQRLGTELRGIGAGHRFPQYSLHRGDLQHMLLEAVRDRLGDQSIIRGARIDRFREEKDGVIVESRHATSGAQRTLISDLLIGAEGWRSNVRAQLHPEAMAVRHARVQMWRGVTEINEFLDGETMIVANDNQTRRLIAYPISAAHRSEGKALINWVCLVPDALLPASALNSPVKERASVEEVLDQYKHWRMEWLDLEKLLGGSANVYRDSMVDREPLTYWGTGRVTLLGDAAHLMYPVGAHGGSQAILDGFTLADALTESDDVTSALRCYEAVRQPATSQVVHANRDRDAAERAMADRSEQEKAAALTNITQTYNAIVERTA